VRLFGGGETFFGTSVMRKLGATGQKEKRALSYG